MTFLIPIRTQTGYIETILSNSNGGVLLSLIVLMACGGPQETYIVPTGAQPKGAAPLPQSLRVRPSCLKIHLVHQP